MGAAGIWSVVMLVFWVALAAGAAWAAVKLIGQPRKQPPRQLPSPLDILERRYAAGEITREDFDEARARLREHELDL
ncbi:MAG TPA: SHOCT domain-containing protein [Kribbella sp.]|nr:SHOCT domain-containing protein [Kribbella sp.]